MAERQQDPNVPRDAHELALQATDVAAEAQRVAERTADTEKLAHDLAEGIDDEGIAGAFRHSFRSEHEARRDHGPSPDMIPGDTENTDGNTDMSSGGYGSGPVGP